MDIGTVLSLGLAEHISRHPDNHPVEKLNEGDDAEAQEEAEEPSEAGDEVNRAHSDAPFKLWEVRCQVGYHETWVYHHEGLS